MNEEGRGAIGSQLVGERAKIILDEVRELSLLDRSQCLQHIGNSHVYRCSSFEKKIWNVASADRLETALMMVMLML